MAQRMNLLTKAEAAEILRVSERTVEMLISNGQLPAYRIAKTCTRIDEADLDAYIDSRRTRFAQLRQIRVTGPKDLRRKREAQELAAKAVYVPGMKVVDPNG